MPIATTCFIKAQIPGTDVHRLLKVYLREIMMQGAESAMIRGNTVEFSGGSGTLRAHRSKFAGFTAGRLIIEETESTFEIVLEADSPKWILLFDVYFTTLRNDIERELQSGRA